MAQLDRLAASNIRPTRRFRGLAIAAATCVCVGGFALPLLNRVLPPTANAMTWLLDLAAHWQSLYALCWLALCVFCGLRTRRWLLLAPLALLPLVTASKPLAPTGTGTPALTVIAANVHAGNRDPAPLVTWLRATPADVVVISELTPAYADALQRQLGDNYPYREFSPDDSPFGIGIMARKKLDQVRRMQYGRGQVIMVQVIVGQRATRVIAAHPMPPLAPGWQAERNALLKRIADTADTPVILAGDLNATPWSSALIDAERGGLRRTTSLAPTWPRWGAGVFGIPIDHVLASGHWRGGKATRGPDIGSDHYPVRVELHWADAPVSD